MAEDEMEDNRMRQWGAKKPPFLVRFALDWLSWTWDRYRLVYYLLALAAFVSVVSFVHTAYVNAVIVNPNGVSPISLPDTAKRVAVLALCVSMVSALAGVLNFVLSRFRIVGVHDVRTTYQPGKGHELQCDIRAYGAAVHDLSVIIEIWIPPTPESVKDDSVGTQVIRLRPVGKVHNPLSAGQGQYFVLREDDVKKLLRPDLVAFQEKMFKDTCDVLAKSKLRNVSLCVYCADERKRLRRVRTRAFHWGLSFYYKGSLKVRETWWQKLSLRLYLWKTQRENERLKGDDDDKPQRKAA